MAIDLGEGKKVLSMTLINLDTGEETLLFERGKSRCHFYGNINYQNYKITLRIHWDGIKNTDPVLDADIYPNISGKKSKGKIYGPWHHTLKEFDENENQKIYHFSFDQLKLNFAAKMTFSLSVGMDAILVEKNAGEATA